MTLQKFFDHYKASPREGGLKKLNNFLSEEYFQIFDDFSLKFLVKSENNPQKFSELGVSSTGH